MCFAINSWSLVDTKKVQFTHPKTFAVTLTSAAAAAAASVVAVGRRGPRPEKEGYYYTVDSETYILNAYIKYKL